MGLTALILIWALVAGTRWAMILRDSVTLPNGMVFSREFDWSRYGRWDLFATDGRTRLARDVGLACFNDRYLFVKSYDNEFTGLYDVQTQSKVLLDYPEAMKISGLSKPGGGCDGYYTGWVGPGLLLEDGRYPSVPSCGWRNVGNEELRDREWFNRPCAQGSDHVP